jgi:hypothetical protein
MFTETTTFPELYELSSNKAVPAGSEATPAWQASPYVLLRLSGKPFDEFDQLALKQTSRLLQQAQVMQSQLHATRDELCDVLYCRIGKETDADIKSKLVALKRDVFNLRPLTPTQQAFLETNFEPSYAAQVRGYYQRGQAAKQAQQEASQMFEPEMNEKRRLFQQALHHEDFLHGLALSQPVLMQKARRGYLMLKPEAVRAKERKVEDKLFRYFARMATKTSPFSRFGPVVLSQTNYPTSRCLVHSMAMTSKIRFNESVAACIAIKLSQRPDIRPWLCPRINPTLVVRDSSIHFTAEVMVKEGDSLRVYPMLRNISAHPLILKVLQILQADSQTHPTLAAWQGHLRTLAGANPDQQARVIQTIDRLIEFGAIVVAFDRVSDTFNRLRDLRDQILALKQDGLQPIVDKLTEIENGVERYAHANADERVQLSRQIAQCVGTLIDTPATQAGQSEDNEFVGDTEIGEFLYEDAQIKGVQFELGEDIWQPLRRDLGLFLSGLLARDQGGNGRLMLRDIFVETFGPGGQTEDLATFANQYMHAVSDPSHYRSDQHSRMWGWSQRLVRAMEKLDHRRGAPAYDVTEDFYALQSLFESAPPCERNKPRSLVVMGQLAATSCEAAQRGDFRFVVNSVLPGYGHFFSRYCDLFKSDDLAGRISKTLEDYEDALSQGLPKTREVVEMLSVMDNNAQIHPSLTRRHIVMPGERSSLPVEQQIFTHNLTLRHDIATDELVLSEKNGTDLEPMYMGFFHTGVLNGLHRLLADLSPSGHHFDHIKPSTFPASSNADESAGEGGSPDIRFFPRLHVGRVIFQRATWVVPIANLVPLLAVPDGFESFKAGLEWAQAHHLPRRVFIRVPMSFNLKQSEAPATGQSAKSGGLRGFHQQLKPIMVDFENYFSVRQFFKTIESIKDRADASLRIEEMLPDADQLLFQHNNQSFVLEMQLQLDFGFNTGAGQHE